MSGYTIDGRTAEEWRAMKGANLREAADSFERCDTDGFMSQWASGISAQEADLKARLCDSDGMIEIEAAFLLDGRIASTHLFSGQYGLCWVMNDEAEKVVGKRFVGVSSAKKGQRRYDAERKKGIVTGTIRVKGYVTTVGANITSVRAVIKPVVECLKNGEYEIVSTDNGPGADW